MNDDAATREAVDGADDSDSATSDAKPAARRNTVRFTADSVGPVGGGAQDVATAVGDESSRTNPRRKKHAAVPHVGDEVRFRVATHRKTGVKRAVELVVTASAKAKLEQEVAAKLATMVRELGVIDRMKAGGGFIKCCDRLEDVYFPLHEIIRDEPNDSEAAGVDSSNDSAVASSEPSRKTGAGKKPTLREGDEVSFFVYEEVKDDESGRGSGRARLTALRVQRAPKGSVSFEDPVRSNVDGIVSKSPKEPRNGPEVVGAITPDTEGPAAAASVTLLSENKENADNEHQEETTSAVADDTKVPAAGSSDATKKVSNKAKAKAKKHAMSPVASVAFRLSDTHDMSYSPLVGDAVRFDEVLDKRSGKLRAVNVRVVQLNPKNRERGVITSLRDDFGFIKCADRAMDAYFRFSDVMAAQRDYRLGTEVSFDVNVDASKPENVRATRVEVLPKGTVAWETTVEEGLEGEVVVVPSTGRSGLGTASGGGRGSGGSAKGSLKVTPGRVRFTTSAKRFWLEFFPELKEKIDSKFVAAEGHAAAAAPAPAPPASNADSEAADASSSAVVVEKKRKGELKLLFPASLSKSERFAIHQYCDELGIQHQSSGDGATRRLELVASAKVAAKSAAAVAALPALEQELKMEDLAEVRYSPQVGDRVQFALVLATRTKQFACKSVVCVASASGTPLPSQLPLSASATGALSKKGAVAGASRGEGFIVAVRSEGFGFIQPADGVASSFDENLFFHIKEVTTGETLESLKVGMEVEYTASFDAVKQKTRALAIKVLPAGTVTKAAPQVLRGVVTRPSLLHPMKAKGRFVKGGSKQATSTVGKIRIAVVDGANSGADANDNADTQNDGDAEDDVETDGATDDAVEGDTTSKKATTKATATRKSPKAAAAATNPFYAYHLKDVVDASVVLREGDEVEFTATTSAKGPRASKIRVLALHAKQGVVVKVHDDLGGVIRVDPDGDDDAAPLELPFTAKQVLLGDILGEGDRVEFAHSLAAPSSTRKIGTAAAAKSDADAASGDDSVGATEGVVATEAAEEVAAFVGQATSVLRLSAGTGTGSATVDARTRAPRTVNSSLLQAMRDVGASATVASRMAKGPDGSRGFKDGWRTAPAADASADVGGLAADGVVVTAE